MNAWSFVYKGYNPEEEGRRETLCTLGNGFFATRGAAPESSDDGIHYPGAYIAGLYNRLRTHVDGFERKTRTWSIFPTGCSSPSGSMAASGRTSTGAKSWIIARSST